MRVLIFGASITQGFYDSEGGWVLKLWKYYTQEHRGNPTGRDITIFNLGISGDGSDRLLKRFKNETEARRFPGEDYAFVFSIGTNNSWVSGSGEPVSTPQKYANDIRGLIRLAREYSEKIMFVGIAPCDESRSRPIPWNNDIFFTNQRLLEFDNKLTEICENAQVTYLPIFEFMKQKLEKEDIYEDGLHPNEVGHQLIYELVQPALDKLLK
jgi:lysophospholipase L1-like esterase